LNRAKTHYPVAALFLLLFALTTPVRADSPRHVLLVLTDRLTWSDMAQVSASVKGTVGLMSPGRPLGPDPVASLYATVGAGDSVAAGDVSEGLLCRALHAASKRVAVIGDADGDDTGMYRPVLHVIPTPDIALFGRSACTDTEPLAPGGRLINPGLMALLTVQTLSGNHLVVVHLGDMERLEREDKAGFLLPAAYRTHRRVAVGAVAAYLNDVTSALAVPSAPSTHLILVGAAPVRAWDHLTPIVVADINSHAAQDSKVGDFYSSGGTRFDDTRGEPGTRLLTLFPLKEGTGVRDVLTSPTTHTPGLIAARDIAPTILTALGVPIPIQMTGAAVRSVATDRRGASKDLTRLDRITTLDQQVQTPVFWVFGFVGGFVVFISLGLFAIGKKVDGPVLRYALRVLTAWPLALLLASVFDPTSVGAYLGWIGLLSMVIGFLPSPTVIVFVTSVAVVIDAFFGSPLVARSILSGYALSGIRFYGIGNEYMGVLIGGALMAPVVFTPPPGFATPLPLSREGGFWRTLNRFFRQAERQDEGRKGVRRSQSLPQEAPTQDKETHRSVKTIVAGTPLPLGEGTGVRVGRRGLFLWFALVTFVLSFPAFGAKAGGAITATATFLFAWWELHGKRITVARMVGAIALGFAVVIVWGIVARLMGLTPTHIDAAVDALAAGRFGYIIGVTWRKIGLALRIILHPGTMVGIAALVGFGVFIKTLLGDRLRALWGRSPSFAAVVRAGLRGCVVALLFNDSGVIAAILIVTSLMMPIVYALFTAGSEVN